MSKGNLAHAIILDADEKPIDVDGGSAKDQILLTGDFVAAKGMRVIVKTVGGQSFQARLAPLN